MIQNLKWGLVQDTVGAELEARFRVVTELRTGA